MFADFGPGFEFELFPGWRERELRVWVGEVDAPFAGDEAFHGGGCGGGADEVQLDGVYFWGWGAEDGD